MAEAFIVRRGGSGGGLNLSIIGGLSEPSNPKQNLIWVNTDEPITQVIFNEDGNAWKTEKGAVNIQFVSTSDYDPSGLNTIIYNKKLNGHDCQFWIKLTGCKQSDGSVLNDVEAYIRKGSSWVQFAYVTKFLYYNGNEFINLTGGWVAKHSNPNYTTGTPSIRKESNRIVLPNVSRGSFSAVTSSRIQLEGFKKLKVKVSTGNNSALVVLLVSSSLEATTSDYAKTDNLSIGANQTKVFELDISSVSSGFVKIANYNTSEVIINEVLLEV